TCMATCRNGSRIAGTTITPKKLRPTAPPGSKAAVPAGCCAADRGRIPTSSCAPPPASGSINTIRPTWTGFGSREDCESGLTTARAPRLNNPRQRLALHREARFDPRLLGSPHGGAETRALLDAARHQVGGLQRKGGRAPARGERRE